VPCRSRQPGSCGSARGVAAAGAAALPMTHRVPRASSSSARGYECGARSCGSTRSRDGPPEGRDRSCRSPDSGRSSVTASTTAREGTPNNRRPGLGPGARGIGSVQSIAAAKAAAQEAPANKNAPPKRGVLLLRRGKTRWWWWRSCRWPSSPSWWCPWSWPTCPWPSCRWPSCPSWRCR
jgi:hypothetical protein